ncbi:hypothetical protein BGZ75_009334 [Mortierella antarctica]|nr:hypothetical protein BGZ75_009334 [Mortierella antarctica]
MPPHHAYQQYAHTYHSSAQHAKHTEGYEGRVRNTTRDHNDHLMTDPSVKDQQHHHDQFRRDPTYGYLKQHPVPSSPYAQFDEDRPSYKYNLPPILAPEEPFYRSDLPGRHMRYFSTVTSEDRENSQGYYSSARHVAPSNTTGNFGHGPPINAALEKFGNARQRQMEQQMEQQREKQLRQDEEERQRQQREEEEAHHQQQHRQRLPSLYTALPEQRPGSSPAMAPQQLQSRGRSPVRKPRSIAPAPLSTTGPLSPIHPISPTSYRNKTNSAYSERSSMIKTEPKDSPQMSYYQQHQQHSYQPYSPRGPPRHQQHQEQSEQRYMEQSEQRHQHQQHRQAESEGKRKWSRDHSPVRIGPRLKVCVDPTEQRQPSQQDETSAQELHLLSQRAAKPTLAVAHAPKIKSGIQHPRMRMQRYQMTTIRCWHGAIAQKSYGIEKRYLCPPPMVQVSAGVNAKQIRAEQPHVTMSILHEKLSNNSGGGSSSGSENLMEQDCTLDDLLKCSFRNLHVTGTGADSSKRFKLGLQVYLNQNSTIPTAIMDSNPIPIISKPSKKTAKAGNASCFILNGMSVSLLNRINAQTVRTKYMAVDKNAVCAKIGSWSSFTIKMVKPPPAPPVKIVSAAGVNGGNMGIFKAASHSTKFVPIRMKGDNSQSAAAPIAMGPPSMGPIRSSGATPQQQQQQQSAHASFQHQQQQQHRPPVHRAPQSQSQQQPQQEPTYVFSNSEPVLYGSEIILVNDMTGITTDRLIIRKVENGKVVRNGSGPVSQMQKIVLQHPDRVHPEDGRPYYLSASSIGSPKIEGKIPLQAAMDRSPLLEYRTSSKKASIMDLTEQAEDDEEYYDDEGGYHGHSGSRRASRSQDNVAVDDFVCWTIAGIAKFDYTYFGPIPASVDTEVDPRKVPKVLNCPQYKSQSNTLVMKVKNVFERLSSAEEETRLRAAYLDDPYERKLTLSEFVYKRCEDVRQPMQDEEGPIQLWLAQHGPVRMRRRVLKEILPEEESHLEMTEQGEDHEEETDEEEDQDEEAEQEAAAQEAKKQQEQQQRQMEDKLPKIPTKANAAFGRQARQQQQHQQQQKYYGGSHLPSTSATQAGQKKKRVKLLARPMGLEAELPFGCEVRAAHDSEGNAHAEMDILMVERATGIAYRTGYKVAYSRQHDSSDWVVEVVG